MPFGNSAIVEGYVNGRVPQLIPEAWGIERVHDATFSASRVRGC